MRSNLKTDYFEWMMRKVDAFRRNRPSYYRLLEELNNTEFEFIIDMDANRVEDGIDLRYRFAYENDIDYSFISELFYDDRCSILEMMVALAIDCEEHIMYDQEIGDRTPRWFWSMIDSLGLMDYDDAHYNERRVKEILSRFIKRKYKPNGEGGLFTLKHPKEDLRTVEIWYQLNWYLDELIDNER